MPTVLVVDDSSVDRRLAAGLIEQLEGWKVITAPDGAAALAAVAQDSIDIVVTDLQMPHFSGLDLVRELRKQFPQVAVVLMTAQGSEEIAVQALQAGAASYVPKRALATELVATVRRVLSAATDERSQQSLVNRLKQRTESYAVETDLALLMAMSRHLQHEIGETWGLDKTERLRIGTAIEEALLNAYFHGSLEVQSDLKDEDYSKFNALAEERSRQSPYRDRMIHVTLEINLQTLQIVIRDEGPGFDPKTLPDPTDTDNIDRLCGRGVMLMRAFMNDVRFNDAGNEVTLIKQRFAG
jgi:DNA-binding response OmpR family regulator